MTWAIPTLVGSLAYDAVADRTEGFGPSPGCSPGRSCSCSRLRALLPGRLGRPAALRAARRAARGDLWTMSQRTGSVSYQTFAAGFSLAVYALFVQLCDLGRLRSASSGPSARTLWPPTSSIPWSPAPSSRTCRRLAALVRHGGFLALFRDFLFLHPLHGEEWDLLEALNEVL